MRKRKPEPEAIWLYGRNAVWEALQSPLSPIMLYVEEEENAGPILEKAEKDSIPVQLVPRQKLDQLAEGGLHQGFLLKIPPFSYQTVSDLLQASQKKGTPPFLLLCDGIEDPHNLGALIRTAAAAGADGMILPKDRSASVNGTVFKTSAGACANFPIARVSNLSTCIKELKKENIWVYGADMEGESLWETDFSGGVALVIGSEGKGMHQLVRLHCDKAISIPQWGRVNSLNASVAGGILLYEVARSRQQKKSLHQ